MIHAILQRLSGDWLGSASLPREQRDETDKPYSAGRFDRRCHAGCNQFGEAPGGGARGQAPRVACAPIAFSSLGIALFGYLVWGHHMFTSGMSDQARMIFSLLTFLVAVPSGIKVFNWVASMYKGSIQVDAPFLFVMAFIFLLSIGGLTGLVQGALATNVHVHGTYFIVAHFHYVMFGGTAFAFIAALHYWFPKMTGRMYSEVRARIAAIVLFVGFNLLYFPLFVLGWQGMPRRYYDYPPEFQWLNVASTIGSWILASGILLMLYNLLQSMKHGREAGDNPWGGTTLEWQTSSPPPTENFEKVPEVTTGPYNYKK